MIRERFRKFSKLREHWTKSNINIICFSFKRQYLRNVYANVYAIDREHSKDRVAHVLINYFDRPSYIFFQLIDFIVSKGRWLN